MVRNNESKKREFSTCENNSGVHLPSLTTSVYLRLYHKGQIQMTNNIRDPGSDSGS